MVGLATIREGATTLGIKEKSLRKWIAQGRVPSVRLGRAVRVRWGDIEKIIAGGLRAVERSR